MGALTEVFSNFLLFFLVFSMSATVEIDKLRKQLSNRHALLTGISLQFLILPFVGFMIVKIFSFPAPIGITLLVVTSSPGGSYSNWWCSLFNAELALSVTMTALSTMLSVIMLPVNLVIYASGSYSSAVVKSLDWYALFMSIFVVIGGISSGLFCSAYFKDSPSKNQIHRMANRLGNVAGLSLITYSVLVSSSDHKAALWDQDWQFFVGIAIPALIGITVATVLATSFDLEKPERVAVAVESSYQNTALATSVAVVMFDGNEDDLATAISVPLYYGMVEAILLATYCVLCWKIGWTKAPPDEKLCVVLATSYEVEIEEAEAHATSVGVVLGDISNSEGNDDLEKADKVDALSKPPLIFVEHADKVNGDESSLELTGTVILQKADNDGPVATAESHRLSLRELEESNNLSYGSHAPLSPTDTEPLSEYDGGICGEYSTQQMDGSGRDGEAKQAGRISKTISFVKARATGYRRAPLPNDDEGGHESLPQIIEPPTGNIEAGGAIPDRESLRGDQMQSEEIVEDGAPDAPPPASLRQDGETTPAQGKTID